MRSKSILSVAAFIIAFTFSTFLASFFIVKTVKTAYIYSDHGSRSTSCFRGRFQSETANSISNLLRQDIKEGRERALYLLQLSPSARPPFENENFDEYAETVEQYVDFSSNLDADNLPQDFQNAWHNHMKAWRNYSDFLNEAKNSDGYSIEKLTRLDNKYGAEIDSTWYKVLRVGKAYGAETY